MPWEGMKHKGIWSELDLAGQVVLEIGAESGALSDFLLRQGAAQVVAVEANEAFSHWLELLAREREGLVAVHQAVQTGEDLTRLIDCYQPDGVVVDCWGCEQAVLELDEAHFRKPNWYMIKTHEMEVVRTNRPLEQLVSAPERYLALKQRFQEAGWRILADVPYCCGQMLLAARGERREK